MKSIIVGIIVTVLSVLFLHKPFAWTQGGTVKLWKCLLFDMLLGIGAAFLAHCFLTQ